MVFHDKDLAAAFAELRASEFPDADFRMIILNKLESGQELSDEEWSLFKDWVFHEFTSELDERSEPTWRGKRLDIFGRLEMLHHPENF